MGNFRAMIVQVVLGLMLTSFASAVPAVTVADLTGNAISGSAVTGGWEFTTNAAISVTDLGFFDSSQDGLAEVHDVGIFSAAGALLVSATVPAGVVGPLINQFRYVAIAPTLLASGQTFRIGAFFSALGPDSLLYPATGLSTDPAITYVGSRVAFGPSLADPTSSDSNATEFGPNFIFIPAAAPAPEIDSHFGGALGCVLLLLGLLEGRRRSSLAS